MRKCKGCKHLAVVHVGGECFHGLNNATRTKTCDCTETHKEVIPSGYSKEVISDMREKPE